MSGVAALVLLQSVLQLACQSISEAGLSVQAHPISRLLFCLQFLFEPFQAIFALGQSLRLQVKLLGCLGHRILRLIGYALHRSGEAKPIVDLHGLSLTSGGLVGLGKLSRALGKVGSARGLAHSLCAGQQRIAPSSFGQGHLTPEELPAPIVRHLLNPAGGRAIIP